MGRPLKQIDPKQVENLAAIGCTQKEIGLVVGCTDDTLHNRFSEVLEKGWAQRNISLRRAQFKAALAGNAVMLIWLGKQVLRQQQNPELEGALDPLKELVDEYRKRYELLIRSREDPTLEKAEKLARKTKSSKKVEEEATNADA
jgi:hypothetical protein